MATTITPEYIISAIDAAQSLRELRAVQSDNAAMDLALARRALTLAASTQNAHERSPLIQFAKERIENYRDSGNDVVPELHQLLLAYAHQGDVDAVSELISWLPAERRDNCMMLSYRLRALTRRGGRIDEALRIFDQLGSDASRYDYAAMMEAFHRAGEPQKVREWFGKAETAQVGYVPAMFITRVLSALAEDKPALAIESARTMQDHGWTLKRDYFRLIVRKSLELKLYDELVKSLIELDKTYGVAPSQCRFYLRQVAKYGRPELVLQLLNLLRAKDTEIQSQDYEQLLNAYGRAGRIDEMVKVLDDLNENGIRPTSAIFAAAIHFLAKSGQIDRARILFGQMLAAEIPPQRVHFTALARGACDNNDIDSAVQVVHEMRLAGFQPDFGLLLSLLNLCDAQSRSDAAERLLDGLTGEKAALVYSRIIRMLGKIGDSHNVLRLQKEAQQHGLRLSDSTMRSIALHAHHDPEQSLRGHFAEGWKDLAFALRDVVHELNQPGLVISNGITAAIEYLDRGGTDKARESLRRALDASMELGARLGNYRMLVAQVDQTHTTPLTTIVERSVKPLEEEALDHLIQIDVDLGDAGHLMIPGDAFSLVVALRGMLKNSIQALASSKVPERLVSVRAVRGREAGGQLTGNLFLSDNGPGIPPEHRAKIFERGFTTKRERGLGLGLSLAQSAVEAHGGTLILLDEGPGARFLMKIPASEELPAG